MKIVYNYLLILLCILIIYIIFIFPYFLRLQLWFIECGNSFLLTILIMCFIRIIIMIYMEYKYGSSYSSYPLPYMNGLLHMYKNFHICIYIIAIYGNNHFIEYFYKTNDLWIALANVCGVVYSCNFFY
jgi:hypothetical protein